MRHLSESESLCAVKKLQPFLLLHSPKQVAGFEFAPVFASTDLVVYRLTRFSLNSHLDLGGDCVATHMRETVYYH